jgi:hypothetical protein
MLDRTPKPDVAARSPRSLPARFPSGAVWPIEMPADMAAALLGYETTGRLSKAIMRGEAPRPTLSRLRKDGRREPVWALDACRKFVGDRHGMAADEPAAVDSLADLI